MRKFIFFVLFALSIAACKNSNDSVNPSPTEGVWKVSYYLDSGKDETSDFAGYTFEFKSDGKFIANYTGKKTTGTWSENTSSKKLIIQISGTKQLDDMSDDWLLIKKTDTVIELKDDNPAGEELHFRKT